MKEELRLLATKSGFRQHLDYYDYYHWLFDLQKWLREEQNVMVELIYIGQSKKRLRSGEVWMCRSDGLIMVVEETYEQALEAGLMKALNKL